MIQRVPDIGTSSAPLPARDTTGEGSLAAIMISQGVVVSRYTENGTVIPFGENIGTADDATAIRGVFDVAPRSDEPSA